MFACPKCQGPMDVEDTSKDPSARNCRRERHCQPCDFTVMTTEVSDAAYHAAVKKRAKALGKEMVADIREILGTGTKKPHR
jgi:transcriptional regulator NrdR family protein